MWPTISSNRLRFTKRFEKYTFFQTINSHDEFLNTPDIEGNIYLKEKSRKSWKKFFCVLRSSGLYFIPKGKSKVKDISFLNNHHYIIFEIFRKILSVWQNLKMLNYFLVLIGKKNLNHQVIFVLH
jgi:hypothetical protein